MIKIALLKPPATYATWYKRPILGISYICAFLQEHGFDCKIYDAYFNGWSDQELIYQVEKYQPDIVGISAMTHEINQAASIIFLLKQKLKIHAIIGGCHITALPESTLAEFPVFDYGVFGEGENTTLELLNSLFDGKTTDLFSIKGLVFRKEDDIIKNEARPWLSGKELDDLPFPSYFQYYGNDRNALSDKSAYYTMFTARGCPYSCSFCMQVLGNQLRCRSPQNIYQELESAINQYGAHTIDFADEIFLINNKRNKEILQLMIDNGLNKKIRWYAMTRANLVNNEIISLAKEAGCYHLDMGVESGDDNILKSINKKITIEQVENAVKIIKKAGLELGTYYIIGHPNETKASMKKTVKLAIRLNTDTIAVGNMVPYPGTEIFAMAQKGEGGYKLLSEDWSDYDKYGGKVLELENLSFKEIRKYQNIAIFLLYIFNFRFFDLFRYLWRRKHAIYYFFAKIMSKTKVTLSSRLKTR